MMRINKHNYEAWFLDYYENNLSPDMLQELFSFLKHNPNLKIEFEQFKNICLPNETITFEHKETIKQLLPDTELNSNNFEQFCIAFYENDLSEYQKTNLLQHTKNDSESKNVFELYRNTKLEPDTTIVYPRKYALKRLLASTYKTKPFINKTYLYLSLAASIMLLFYIFHFNSEQKNNTSAIIADVIIPADTTTKSQAMLNQNSMQPEKIVKPQSDSFVIPKNKIDAVTKIPVIEFAEIQTKNISEKEIFADDYKEVQPVITISKNETTTSTPDKNITEFVNWRVFAMNKLGIEPTPKNKKHKTTFWDIADAGLQSVSKLTGKKFSLKTKKHEDGKVGYFAFNTPGFSIEKGSN
jgi:hypothetical protein